MTDKTQITFDEAWDQIPWLINGTLDEDEAAAVRAFIASSPDCKAEYERQLRLSDAVREFDAGAPDPAMALDSIAHRLTRPKPAFSLAGWLRAALDRVAAPSGLALSGALAVAAVVVVFGLPLFEPRYETLTTPDPAAEGVEIRLRFQENASVAEIAALMAEVGAANITGPSETGLMRGTIDADIAAEVVERLKSDPRILFVAKDN